MDLELYIVNRQSERQFQIENFDTSDITWELNAEGSFDFTIDSTNPVAGMIETWSHELQILINGNLRWWGVVWTKRKTPGQVQVLCEGLLSLLRKRFIDRTSLQITSEDQAEIAWQLIEYAQTPHGPELDAKDLNILKHTAFPTTGKNRSREYNRNEKPCIRDLLDEFPNLTDGFDFEITFDLTGRRDFMVHYPAQGFYRSEINLVYGHNILDYELVESSEEEHNDAYAMGGSNGEIQFEGHATDDFFATERGIMTHVFSEGSQTDPQWLFEKAEQSVLQHMRPLQTIDIKSIELPFKYFDVIGLGDRISAVIDDGANQFQGFLKVLEITLDVEEESMRLGVEIIQDITADPILGEFF